MSAADWIAAVFVVGGALAASLGGIGLLRFPDVFARMHASTKAATVGAIGVMIGTAIEAGGVAGALVVVLVVALLFISAPLGMSLLARAALYDPETPRPSSMAAVDLERSRRESTRAPQTRGSTGMLALMLMVAWIALFGSLRPNVIAGGLVVSGVLAMLLRELAPRWPEVLKHPIATAAFAWYFASQVAAGTSQVIRTMALPADKIRPAVVEAPLRLRTRSEIMLLMNAISFSPGSVALEIRDDHLYVHVLTTDDPNEVVAKISEMEARIAAAFGRPLGQASFESRN